MKRMTEKQWLECRDPETVFRAYGDSPSARKLVLFCVRCGFLDLNPDQSPDSVKRLAAWRVAERFADGQATTAQVRQSWGGRYTEGVPVWPERPREWAMAWIGPDKGEGEGHRIPFAVLVAVIRDIFGNPFRPVAADPKWLTSTVVQLAKGIYDEKAFDRMPILADALQDAGCDDERVLSHCRDPHLLWWDPPEGSHLTACSLHSRGCWAIDMLLGKE